MFHSKIVDLILIIVIMIAENVVPAQGIFAGHPISFYLANQKIPQVCKDIYVRQKKISDDPKVLAIIDSVFTSNNETSPFYFLVLTQTMEKADGSYSEPFGIMTKAFVEKRTKEFLNYFIYERILTKQNFSDWAQFVVGEIGISSQNKEKVELENVKLKMKTNCTDCSSIQSRKLSEFFVLLDKSLALISK